ncbi:MAG: protein tyrosine phosphatase (PTP) superfamily phosphohydrolase (DUF442 family) [Neolewinella sp.]|jgi:protein tyrosine phosphatase (PTP) superfamily phosphohydrolase (DUF442 family)
MHASPRRMSFAMQLPTFALLAVTSGCLSNDGHSATQQPDVSHVIIEAPKVTNQKPVHLFGVHNVVTYAQDLVCGGVPEGAEGFATLKAMGIKTVISVDGATPDLDNAKANGLRYVHLPIGYDTVIVARQQELARAIMNVERPIYVHCHHGKHRSGAGLGTAMIRAGLMTVDEVSNRMRVSGTSKNYAGLWQSVREARPMAPELLIADPDSFPSITQVTGMVAMMAELDEVLDLVRQSHKANWQAPSDHPDLVAEKETRRLRDLFRRLRDEPESQKLPDGYQQMLGHTIDLTDKLDRAVRNGDAAHAAQLLDKVGKDCKSCHREYRNK